MSRPATLQDHIETLKQQHRRRTVLEQAWCLRLKGWSHRLVVDFVRRRDGDARGLVEAYVATLDLYEHGIQPPTHNVTSGRIRKDNKPIPNGEVLFEARYKQV